MKTITEKDFSALIRAITALVQLCFVYLVITWGYDLVTFVMTTLAKPFMGGA